jgi:hypothetical protein
MKRILILVAASATLTVAAFAQHAIVLFNGGDVNWNGTDTEIRVPLTWQVLRGPDGSDLTSWNSVAFRVRYDNTKGDIGGKRRCWSWRLSRLPRLASSLAPSLP